MNSKHSMPIVHTSFALKAGSCLLACMLVCIAPFSAYASVLSTDEVLGDTVANMQLNVSQCPNIDATQAILVDSSGTVIFSRDAYSGVKIASITKIMTAIVAIEHSSLTDTVTISAAAAQIGESSAELQEGNVLTMESALKALLVPSGNDAAVAIAETIGKKLDSTSSDPVSTFVAYMNQKAAELGCADTIFTNPHGLDDEEYAGELHSTASDVSIISRYAMTNTTIRAIVSGGTTTIPVTREGVNESVELETTDEMLELYEYTIGIKTGNTLAAGPCFSSAISRDGKELYAVVLNSSSESQRFYDCIELFDWYFDHLNNYAVCNTSEYVYSDVNGVSSQIPVVAHVAHADWTDVTFPATFSNPNLSVEVFDLNGNVSQVITLDEVHGSVKQGDKVGTAVFYQRNEVVATVDVVAAQDCAAPNPFEAIGVWFSRLFSGITGKASVAESTIVNTTPLIIDKSLASL